MNFKYNIRDVETTCSLHISMNDVYRTPLQTIFKCIIDDQQMNLKTASCSCALGIAYFKIINVAILFSHLAEYM